MGLFEVYGFQAIWYIAYLVGKVLGELLARESQKQVTNLQYTWLNLISIDTVLLWFVGFLIQCFLIPYPIEEDVIKKISAQDILDFEIQDKLAKLKQE